MIIKICQYIAIGFFLTVTGPLLAAPNCTHITIDAPELWPPYSVRNADGSRDGRAFRLIREIFKGSSTQLTVSNYLHWSRSLNELKRGNLDVIIALRKTTERADYMDYSVAWHTAAYGLAVRKDSALVYEGLGSLENLKGAAINGFAVPSPYDQLPAIFRTPDAGALMRILMRGRVDYAVVSVGSFDGLLEQNGISGSLKIMTGSRLEKPIFMAVSKQTKCAGLREFIDQRIMELQSEGYLAAVN